MQQQYTLINTHKLIGKDILVARRIPWVSRVTFSILTFLPIPWVRAVAIYMVLDKHECELVSDWLDTEEN